MARRVFASLALLPLLSSLPAPRPASAAGDEGVENVYSVQMHVHGSFSEGTGSIDSQTAEALGSDVDVIWWSDHDYRMTYYHHVSRFSFEGWREAQNENEPWTPRVPWELNPTKTLTIALPPPPLREAGFTDAVVYEGQRSLRLRAGTEAQTFEPFYFQFSGADLAHQRTLASEVDLALAIFPEKVGADGRPAVKVILSDHPANSGVPEFAQYELHYYLDNDGGPRVQDGGAYHIPLAYTPNQWNAYVLPISKDAAEGFPFIHAGDNRMFKIQLGLEVRRGFATTAYFDDLRIQHRIAGNELFGIQREMLDRVQDLEPGVEQLQGTEISKYRNHLNEFSVGTELVDYDEIAELSGLLDEDGMITDLNAFNVFVSEHVTDLAHAKGGLISLNHMFGTGPARWEGTREELRDFLLDNGAYGVDILEVGYREREGWTLADYLWVWDELAKNGLRLVGTGVSDSHGGSEGHWNQWGFVSWIHAPSPSKADLIDAMDRGRVFFGEIFRFDGKLDIATPEGFEMGQIVVTQAEEQRVGLLADGVEAGDEIRVIEAGEQVATYTATGPVFEQSHTVSIPPGEDTFVRFEVHGPDTVKVLSNPIYFVREAPAEPDPRVVVAP